MKKVVLLGAAILFSMAGTASADSFGFVNISADKIADAAIGEAQLSVDVMASGSDGVLFTFKNSGPAASSITDIYFDTDASSNYNPYGLSFLGFLPSSGVLFSVGATPPNLPAKNNVTPQFKADYSFDSDDPVSQNGVDPGESLGIMFGLSNGYTFEALVAGLMDTSFRIGIHVQAFAGGGSESFVNGPPETPVNPVPEPATLLLFGSGVAGLLGLRRKSGK